MLFFDIFKSKCAVCKRKVSPVRNYVDDKGKLVKVCIPCSEYAERRAFRVKK
jgi:hypothetical protein